MKQILLMIAVVVGQSVLAADKKPLTKKESAKVIEKSLKSLVAEKKKKGYKVRRDSKKKVTRTAMKKSYQETLGPKQLIVSKWIMQ